MAFPFLPTTAVAIWMRGLGRGMGPLTFRCSNLNSSLTLPCPRGALYDSSAPLSSCSACRWAWASGKKGRSPPFSPLPGGGKWAGASRTRKIWEAWAVVCQS